jgi:hypothetical protein
VFWVGLKLQWDVSISDFASPVSTLLATIS